MREATAELMRGAKERGVTILLIGHVTKDGGLAGPRTLEHLVDCVLSFEGDDVRAHRVLRATKNRFGSTNEMGVFEMRAAGLDRRRRSDPPLPGRGGRAGRARASSRAIEGTPRAAGRGAGAGRAHRDRPAAPRRRSASTARAWRRSSPCSRATRGCGSATPTSS